MINPIHNRICVNNSIKFFLFVELFISIIYPSDLIFTRELNLLFTWLEGQTYSDVRMTSMTSFRNGEF